jgi:tetratricopeptide (TPR) repeat protein/transcriptional regulator with XRE-family HTH domain
VTTGADRQPTGTAPTVAHGGDHSQGFCRYFAGTSQVPFPVLPPGVAGWQHRPWTRWEADVRNPGRRGVFGEVVRAHRRWLCLSQEDLADKTGINVRSIGKIESGRTAVPRPVTVRLLADAFGLAGADREQFCRAAVSEPTDPPTGRTPVPAQLPADAAGFAGRGDQLRQLTTLLDGGAGLQPTAVVISAVSGTAGVGKTALAVHWAHQVRRRFPDGQLYVNLRGFDPTGAVMTPAEAVRGFLDALDVPAHRIPTGLDGQAALYRSLLADRRMLIVLDNARDAGQVRLLLPGAPGCLALVTSRDQLGSLIAVDGAHPLTLGPLPRAEARELLASRLGADRLAAEPQAVNEVITRCAGLPLALTIVAARAATHPHFPLHTFAAELRDTGGRLDALASTDPSGDVRAVFSWSYRTLTPDAARLFRLLGLHPGPDLSAAAAASLAGLHPRQVWLQLAELTRAHLLVEHTPGRYTFHDLLRAYAAEQAHGIDTDQQRHAATERMLDHYLHTAHTAALLLYPHRDQITLTPPQLGTLPENPADPAQALAWFTTEHHVLLAAIDHAATVAFDTHTCQLAWALTNYLDRRGHWHDWAATQRAALAATQRMADSPAQARAHRLLARVYIRLGRFDDAHAHLQHALDLYRQAGDEVGQARTYHSLAHLCERRGRHAEALDHAQRALDLYRAAGHRHGQAGALNNIGWFHALLGDHQQALTSCQQGLTLLQELGDRQGQASTWDSLGYAHRHLDHHAQALACYEHALHLYRDLGDRYNEADTLTSLGDTHHAAGNPDPARDAWQHALDILTDLDHPDADQVRTKLAVLDTPTADHPG